MRSSCLVLVACLVGCADTAPQGDAQAPCESGSAPRCQGNVHQTCVDGKWRDEDCGELQCFNDYGCKTCAPNSKYCEGQDTFECNADGSQANKTGTCRNDQQCAGGACHELCDLAAQEKTNVGCHFWAVDLPNEYACISLDQGATCNFTYLCAACQQFAIAVANTSTYRVNVVVEINNAAPGEPLQLEKVAEKEVGGWGIELIPLPMREVDCTEWAEDSTGALRRLNDSQTCLSSRAYRITTSHPVVVYQFNPVVNVFSNGASMLIPENGLGKRHWVMGWNTSNPISFPLPGQTIEGMPDYMNVTLIGVEEDTTVEIRTTHPTQGTADGTIGAAQAGDTITVKLGPFDVFNLNSVQDVAHFGDFTGTTVVSDKKVAVFTGGQRISVGGGTQMSPPPPNLEASTCCTEHMEQQIFPEESLGKRFVISRTPQRSKSAPEPDFYRILATEPQTRVVTNLAEFPSFALAKAGDFVDFWAIRGFTVRSEKPIMIGQFAVSQQSVPNWNADTGGDPEFVLFPPVEQARKDYVFLTPPTFSKDYVVISGENDTEISLDGEEISGEFKQRCDRATVGDLDGVTYVSYTCPVEDGPHRIGASKPVAIMVYGYYSVGSYGYPGGADVKDINIK